MSLASQPMLQAPRKSHHAGRTTAAREVRAESTSRDTGSGDAGCLWKLNAGSSAGSSSRGYDATNARRFRLRDAEDLVGEADHLDGELCKEVDRFRTDPQADRRRDSR